MVGHPTMGDDLGADEGVCRPQIFNQAQTSLNLPPGKNSVFSCPRFRLIGLSDQRIFRTGILRHSLFSGWADTEASTVLRVAYLVSSAR